VLAEALHDQAHAEKEAKKWKVLGEHLFKKCVDAFFGSSSDDESRDDFFLKLEEEEEVANQKGGKK